MHAGDQNSVQTPINLRLSSDNGPYFPINLVLLAELQTVELFLYLAEDIRGGNFHKPVTKLFNREGLRSHRLSPVDSWRLGTRCDSQIWNIKIVGCFVAPGITRWRQRRLLGRFDIHLFLFVRRMGR